MKNRHATPEQNAASARSRVSLGWEPTIGELAFIAIASIVLYLATVNVALPGRSAIAAIGYGLIGVSFSLAARIGSVESRARSHELWSVVAALWLCAVPWFLQVADEGVARLVFIPVLALAVETPAMTARRSRTWRFSALLYAISYAVFFVLSDSTDSQAFALVVLAAGFAALSGMGIVGELINRLTQQRDENQELAHTDVLTGLFNRRGWRRALADLADARAEESPAQVFTCVVFDIDHFKRSNERFGHLFGDRQLRQVADLTRSEFSSEWVVSRVGGDEFAAVAPGDRRLEFARFDQRVSAGTDVGVGIEGLALTAGIAVESTADHAWVMALGALRTAKRTQRGTTLFAGIELDQQLLVQKEISLLTSHEVSDVIDLVAQPIVDNGEIIAFECLARWSGKSGATVGPEVFVPIFEEAGLAHMLGHVVVEKAINFARALPESVWVSVNISPSHFQTTSFAAEIARLVAIGRVAPGRLTIEVTESQAVTDHGTWLSNAARLRRLGLGVAVDDFGAGWSSLDRLIQLDLTALKIDRGIVEQLTNPKTRALLAAVAAFTNTIGVRLIAEGVEREEQAKVLRELGFRSMQGYLFGRPVDLETARRDVWDQYLPHTADSIAARAQSTEEPLDVPRGYQTDFTETQPSFELPQPETF